MDFKFSCPHCGQHISCNDQWSGQQIQCPACQANIVVPQIRPIAAEAPAAAKLSVSAPAHTAPPPPPPPPPVAPPRPMPAPVVAKGNKEGTNWLSLSIKVVVAVVVLGVLAYYGRSLQTKVSNAKHGDGGEMGHIADVYSVLDVTDPEHPGMSSAEAKEEAQREAKYKEEIDKEKSDREAKAKAEAEREQMINPAVWTLDLDTSVIPEGRANGMISGVNFTGDSAQILKVNGQTVLNLRQGTNATTEREIFVYLRLNPSQDLKGQSWSVSKDEKSKDIFQVVKRWKKGPAYAPQQNAFKTGYALKLEFGEPNEDGFLPGKIFLALPDTEQSVVAGGFKMETEEHKQLVKRMREFEERFRE